MGEETPKIKILFVCTYNKMRSKTGEELYKDDERFEVRSAGTDDNAPVWLGPELIKWADYVVVMEEAHREWIEDMYFFEGIEKKIIVLDIPDEYWFMDLALVLSMKKKFEKAVREVIGI